MHTNNLIGLPEFCERIYGNKCVDSIKITKVSFSAPKENNKKILDASQRRRKDPSVLNAFRMKEIFGFAFYVLFESI